MEHFQRRQWQQADRLCQQLNQHAPNFAEAWHLRGLIAGMQQRPDLVEAFVRRAISLQPEVPQFHYNLANAYQQQGKLVQAKQIYVRCLQLEPEHINALRNLGILHLRHRELSAAVDCFERAARRAPRDPSLQMSLGIALQQSGNVATAATCFRCATELKPDFAEAHMNLGLCLAQTHDLQRAMACYRRALELKPNWLDAELNLGLALQQHGKLPAAEACFRMIIEKHPNAPEAHLKLGSCLAAGGKPRQAMRAYQRVLELAPGESRALIQTGHALRQLQQYDTAITYYRRALEIEPEHLTALSYLMLCSLECCQWDGLDGLVRRMQQALPVALAQVPAGGTHAVHAPARTAMQPLLSLSLPIGCSPEQQLHCAQDWIRQSISFQRSVRRSFSATNRDRHDGRLRVGYISADFREHPVARLSAELYELHDRQQFQVFGYSLGRHEISPLRTRLMNGFDQFRDFATLPHEQVAQQIAADRIDILIDLTGHTQDNRLEILAMRPAPIQVHYLGYPGTTGADFIDYIIVDEFVVPPSQRVYFSEHTVTLPGCYQVSDRQCTAAERTPSRSDCDLPEEGFVFCCFNNNHKITPEQFALWMRILKRVPGSYLWLLEGHPQVPRNLRREAETCGVAPQRLRFAARTEWSRHLARHEHVDLFLDTLPYNAHTTANDALRAGVPLVTIAGTTFASRVAGSLLHTLGLLELITSDAAEFEQRCVELATHPERLRAIRIKLDAARQSSLLFRTDRFVVNLESAYWKMWALHRAGSPPTDIVIP